MLFGSIPPNLVWLHSRILIFQKFRTSGPPADFTVYFSLYMIFWLPSFLIIMSLLKINLDLMPIPGDICANWKCQIFSRKVILCNKEFYGLSWQEKGGNNRKNGWHRYATQFKISKGSCTDRSFKKFETVLSRLSSLSSPNLLCRIFPGTLQEDRVLKSRR
jgi:hypothetical protein